MASVFGTRPQLVKLAVVWRGLERRFRSVLIDSGQHYDIELAGSFYAGEQIRNPDYHLGVRAGSAAEQIARITKALHALLCELRPDAVITFGDTSTTAAAALAASYSGIPVAHVEAGMRSFDRSSPEEKNRLITDHLSEWLFCSTRTAVNNLKKEGLRSGVFGVGDVMYESFLRNRPSLSPERSLTDFALPPEGYYFLTCHRAENVDDPQRLHALCEVLANLAYPVVFAVHPRARKNLIRHRLWANLKRLPGVQLTPPLSHDLTLGLLASARAVLTDSGGLQREAYWLRTPCLTLRDRTEWVETVRCGANRLVDLDIGRMREALARRWRIREIDDPYFRCRTPSSRILARLRHDLAGAH